jgi:hypothetical protein
VAKHATRSTSIAWAIVLPLDREIPPLKRSTRRRSRDSTGNPLSYCPGGSRPLTPRSWRRPRNPRETNRSLMARSRGCTRRTTESPQRARDSPSPNRTPGPALDGIGLRPRRGSSGTRPGFSTLARVSARRARPSGPSAPPIVSVKPPFWATKLAIRCSLVRDPQSAHLEWQLLGSPCLPTRARAARRGRAIVFDSDAVNNGWIAPCAMTMFCPGSSITRGDLAAVVIRLAARGIARVRPR